MQEPVVQGDPSARAGIAQGVVAVFLENVLSACAPGVKCYFQALRKNFTGDGRRRPSIGFNVELVRKYDSIRLAIRFSLVAEWF
jgi:hypothetical protein